MEPGLYDENDNLVYTWESLRNLYGYDIETNPHDQLSDIIENNVKRIIVEDHIESIITNAFKDCYFVEEIILPEELKYIEDYAFENCKKLKKIELPNTIIRIGEGAFKNCYNMEKINIPDKLTKIDSYTFFNCRKLKNIYLGNNIKEIGECAFFFCDGLSNIRLSESLTKIESSTFSNCFSLTEITIPYNVTEINGMAFDSCYALQKINLHENALTIYEYAFSNCDIRDLYINRYTTIRTNSFQNNKNLRSIKVDLKNEYYDSRNNCNAIIETKTNKLLLGCSETVVPDGIEIIGAFAFCGSNIEKLTLPNTIRKIETSAFQNSKLNEIKLPENLLKIESKAFQNTKIKKIFIPENINSIHSSAFFNCENLMYIDIHKNNHYYDSRNDCNAIIDTTINELIVACKNTVIPNTIKSIGISAFLNIKMDFLKIPNKLEQIKAFSFKGVNIGKLIFYGSKKELEQIKGYNNLFTGNNIELDKIMFYTKPNLDELIENGKTVREINQILKEYEKELR